MILIGLQEEEIWVRMCMVVNIPFCIERVGCSLQKTIDKLGLNGIRIRITEDHIFIHDDLLVSDKGDDAWFVCVDKRNSGTELNPCWKVKTKEWVDGEYIYDDSEFNHFDFNTALMTGFRTITQERITAAFHGAKLDADPEVDPKENPEV